MTQVLVNNTAKQEKWYSPDEISVSENHGRLFLSAVSNAVFMVICGIKGDITTVKIGDRGPVNYISTRDWKDDKIFREIKSITITINELA
jgi:hypothetical protein